MELCKHRAHAPLLLADKLGWGQSVIKTKPTIVQIQRFIARSFQWQMTEGLILAYHSITYTYVSSPENSTYDCMVVLPGACGEKVDSDLPSADMPCVMIFSYPFPIEHSFSL